MINILYDFAKIQYLKKKKFNLILFQNITHDMPLYMISSI